ncbi:MAG: metalloregulator ArsR/SmtB family transcription factor [Tetrasphaera sp.]
MSTWEALVDPTRRSIVTRLAAGDLTAGEIADGFAISRPGVSRHLRVLREADLVTSRREGTRQIYSLNRSATAEIEEWAAEVRRFWESRLDALDTEIRRGHKGTEMKEPK